MVVDALGIPNLDQGSLTTSYEGSTPTHPKGPSIETGYSLSISARPDER